MDVLSWLIVGGVAGWLAGKITAGRGFGLFGNIGIGILGGILGGLLFGVLGVQASRFPGSLVMATVGALLLLYIVRQIGPTGRRRRR
jgi:uncharacterized membrane protein YeaQ/YmgE (transglycosylase-associated protein family)